MNNLKHNHTRANTQLVTPKVGVVVAVSEVAIFVLPISVMAYVPNYFFAATLIFIAFDLLIEWYNVPRFFPFTFRLSSLLFNLIIFSLFSVLETTRFSSLIFLSSLFFKIS